MIVGNQDSNNPLYSDEIRIKIENMFSIQLPTSYIDLMKQWNGGYLKEDLEIPVSNYPESLDYYLSEGLWSIYEIAGISDYATNGLIDKTTTAHDWDIPKDIISFCGDGHTWVAFDYRNYKGNDPKIIFIESDDLEYCELASNFQMLIDKSLPRNEVYNSDGEIIYKP